MILLISILILVHEIGHFIAARICGIRVTRFGFGMPIGPEWKLFKWGHTVFYIHAFLFGGYVSFADDEEMFEKDKDKIQGENKDENKEAAGDENIKENKNNEEDDEILPSDSPELYENKTIGQKLFVVTAGVLMNVVFAILLVFFCAIFYHKLPQNIQNIVVSDFAKEITSNAQIRGIQKGDKILRVNNEEIKILYNLTFFAKNSRLFDNYAQDDLVLKNIDNIIELNKNLSLKQTSIIKKGQEIVLPDILAETPMSVRRDVLDGMENYKPRGIELDDEIIKLRDEIYLKKTFTPSYDIELAKIALALSDTYKPLEITVLRDDKEITLTDIKIDKQGILGIMFDVKDIYYDIKTPKDVIVRSFSYTYDTTHDMLKALWNLFTGKISATQMHGVIAVIKVGGDIIASKGMLNGILLTAMISINLAVMNLLPIPALDGGHVMFLLIEKFTGKKPTKELGQKITNFFFILLIILMVVICYNDIFALVTKEF